MKAALLIGDPLAWGGMAALLPLAVSRMFGFSRLFPLFGPHSFGTLIRNALLFVMSIPIISHFYSLGYSVEAWSMGGYFGMMLQEILIGAMIGFAATVPFWAIDLGCFLIDTLRGSSMGVALNPALGAQSSGLGLLFVQLLSVLFLSSGGLEAVLVTLYDSYQFFPMGEPSIFRMGGWLVFLQSEWRLMFQLGLSFALPSITMMLMVDMALGLLNRSTKQLNIFFVSMPVKSALCLLLLAVSLDFSVHLYLDSMGSVWQGISSLFLGEL